MMRRALFLLCAIALVGCGAPAASPNPPVTTPKTTSVERRGATNGLCEPRKKSTNNASASLEIDVLGSGGPRSFGRAASGYVVFIDGVARMLVDVGPGAFVRLGEMNVDLEHLDTLLLTHLHIDHSGDVPGFVKSRDITLSQALTFRIFGPSGAGDYPSTTAFVDRLFGAQGAFAYLPKFRNELKFEVADLPIDASAPIHEVLRDSKDDVRVTSIAVDHDNVPAVAFRIDHAGHAVVVSGDLASKNENLTHLASNADVLVYDTAVVDPPGSATKLYDLHTAPHRIGEVAAAAHVKSLVLSHIPPQVDVAKEDVMRSVHATFKGDVRFAEDCMRVNL